MKPAAQQKTRTLTPGSFAPPRTGGTFRNQISRELSDVILSAEVRHSVAGAPSYQIDWTPAERKAAAVLNAMRHAIIFRLDIAEELHVHRLGVPKALTRIPAMLDDRRKCWSIFMTLLGEYRALQGGK